jgi:hypothetical protein
MTKKLLSEKLQAAADEAAADNKLAKAKQLGRWAEEAVVLEKASAEAYEIGFLVAGVQIYVYQISRGVRDLALLDVELNDEEGFELLLKRAHSEIDEKKDLETSGSRVCVFEGPSRIILYREGKLALAEKLNQACEAGNSYLKGKLLGYSEYAIRKFEAQMDKHAKDFVIDFLESEKMIRKLHRKGQKE